MQNGTTIALSRLIAQQRAIDVTAGNIANANTPGFRAGRMLFSDWLLAEPAKGRATGERALSYTQDRAIWRDQKAGPISHTGNPFDLTLGDPRAFFTVQTVNGPRLTRAGHFAVSANGGVVDVDGNALLDQAGQPLRVSPTDTGLSVTSTGALASENGPIGTIGAVTVADPTRLSAEGDRLFAAGGATTRDAAPEVLQGAIEDSNVQPISEVTRMMSDTREFQFVAQYVQAEADRQASAIEKLSQRPA